MNRRRLLCQAFVLTPLPAALLAACGEDEGFAEGMLPIKWDRDTCARCGMAISDRRFAVQVRGGAKKQAFKFDDIGCATTWCSEKVGQHSWINDPATRFWVAEFVSAGAGGAGKGLRWLPARDAHYLSGPRSPMGYNLAAYAQAQAGSLSFETMAEQTAATWPANCRSGAKST